MNLQKGKTNWATHLFLATCVIMCSGFLAWAWFCSLDIVSMAQGRVVPSSKVKEIQHLEGGIISEILVQEGSPVTLDQPLVVLEGVISDASVSELQVRTSGLQVDIQLYKAMAEDREALVFSEQLRHQHGQLVEQARKHFTLAMSRYKSELISQEKLIEQRSQEIKGVETRIRNTRESLELLQKQIEISASLLEDQLTTEYKHLSFLREESSLKSKIEEDQSLLNKAGVQLAESREKLQRLRHSHREKASGKLKEARQELEEFNERLKKYKDSQRRTVIRSPVDGVIKSLNIYTIGGVVTPGKTIMDIVPTGDSLVVEARLPIQDIGYLQVGQKAVVNLASRDAGRYGKLDGEVIHISPDAMTSEDGAAFYTARIKTVRTYFERGALRYEFVPGMLVTVYIHTGQRTVLEYLLEPFLFSMGQALQER